MRKAGKQDRVIMAITGHKTMLAFTRYDTVDEADLKLAVSDLKPQNLGTNLAQISNEQNEALKASCISP